jgi:uncharacterized coiled-coil protein SlyX
MGVFALGRNTTAGANTAVGYQALANMTVGNTNVNNGGFNTAVGFKALTSDDTSGGNISGTFNDAFGYQALARTTTGASNVGFGATALFSNIGGVSNTAVGSAALFSSTGSFNTALGSAAGFSATTGDGNVYIGATILGSPGESNHTYIRNINSTSVSGGGTDTVTINLANGLLGHATSSRRYKQSIQPMNKASETLFSLKPVTYRYKKEIDKNQSLDYGLIAEDVAQVDPNLAVRDETGKIESVRYSAINAMLLNEFLKEHKKVEEQQATIAELKGNAARQEKISEQQQKQIDALTTGLQEVSAQLEVSKAAPQTVRNTAN